MSQIKIHIYSSRLQPLILIVTRQMHTYRLIHHIGTMGESMQLILKPIFVSMFALSTSLASIPTISAAQTSSIQSIKTVSIRVLKTVNGWVRILETGQRILLSAKEAYDLGLSPTAAIGHIATVIAIDTFDDAKQLASDIGVASRYVAVDVAMPLLSEGYEYTNGVIIPKSKELLEDGVEYTTTVAVPKAQELASDAYDAAAPVISDATDYTTQTILPNAKEAAGKAADAASSGAKKLWKWATE